MIIQLIVLALALSVDAFGIGISYGVRKINFKLISLAIISCIAILFSSVSILFGNILAYIFSEKMTSFISIFILVLLGIFIIKKGLEKEENKQNKKIMVYDENKKLFSLFVKSLGITINVIKTPSLCDLDKSLKIDAKESLYLGIVLSIDCIGTSIAISSFDTHKFLFPIFIVVFQLTFLLIGTLLGRKTTLKCLNEYKISIVSGLILICMGFLRLVTYN